MSRFSRISKSEAADLMLKAVSECYHSILACKYRAYILKIWALVLDAEDGFDTGGVALLILEVV
jgi:hypothetical protein